MERPAENGGALDEILELSLGGDDQDSSERPVGGQASDRNARDADTEFVWDRGSIVLHEQPETAVYQNPDGFVVIRQRNDVRREDDVVIIDPAHVRMVALALLQEVGLDRLD